MPAEVGVRAPAPPLSGPSPRGRGPAPALQLGRAEPGAHGAAASRWPSQAGARAPRRTTAVTRRAAHGVPFPPPRLRTRASGRGVVALRSAVPLRPARAARLPQAPSPAFLWTDAQTPAGG